MILQRITMYTSQALLNFVSDLYVVKKMQFSKGCFVIQPLITAWH